MDNNSGREANKPPAHWGGGPTAEVLDKTPIEMPIGAVHPKPLNQLVAEMVRLEVQHAKNVEMESFENADDFEDKDPEELDFTKYELQEIEEELENPFYDPTHNPPEGPSEAAQQPITVSADPNPLPTGYVDSEGSHEPKTSP